HSCYEEDSYYAHIPGVRTVVPSTPFDAKGMMHASLRSPDPVVFLYPAGLRTLVEDVPDEPYEVSLEEAAVRMEGSDLTIVSSGAGMPEVLKAAETLRDEGMGVEVVDLRVLKEMDTDTLVNSVAKTKRLLTVDQSYFTLCPGAEVIARVATNVDGAKYKRVAFPDAPPPASPEMFLWMRPDADKIAGAARGLDRVKSALWDGDRLVVVEDIPALLCSACGEQFFEDRTALALDLMRGGGFPPGEAERQMTVEVFRYRSSEPDREGLLALATVAIAQDETYGFMPDGGRTILVQVLGDESIAQVASTEQSEEAWQAWGVTRAPDLSPAELETLAGYAALNFPLTPDRIAQLSDS
ncbi:Pyruvate dehydrogenase E1 component subunit beta, partial [Durusdinium trenchii]